MRSPTRLFKTAASLLLGLAVSAGVAAAATLCAKPPAAKDGAVEQPTGKTMMTQALLLEKQGEADFHLKYDAPAAPCVADSFTVGDASVVATYNPFQKGPNTLLYRLTVTRAGQANDILVIYNGTAAVLAGGEPTFNVSEERDGVISWYAMYRDEPSLADVKTLAEQIIQGRAKPLMAVRWPAGAKEGEMLAFDAQRLK